jgi:dihydrofolate synthase/folylpolyglutamate synthase
VVILEVGLGGRLDASNIVDADIAVVTNIDVDHEDWLGSDVEVIGREKSGIFRSGKIAICGDPNPPGSVQQTAEALGSIFYQRDKDFTVIRQKDRINFTGTVPGGISCHITQLPIPDLPFDSVVAAIQVGLLMGLPVDPVFYQSLSNLGLTGRFQLLKHQSKSIILDVAHNPAAAEHLAKKLQKSVSSGSFTGKTYAVAAMMADKDVTAIISPMVEAVDCWYLGNLPSPRALSADNLRSVLIEQGVNSAHLKHNIPAAFQQAKAEMSEHDRLVVFGSFFTVAEVLDLMASDNDNVAGGIDAG